jgi:thymidylate kinase
LRSGADFVIFDRYIYDELANLRLRNPILRGYARILLAFVPKPQISYLLDADPMQARARKPEYPLEFLHTNRQSYLDLSVLHGRMTVIPPMPVEEVKKQVLDHIMRELSFESDLRIGADAFARTTSRLDKPNAPPAVF